MGVDTQQAVADGVESAAPEAGDGGVRTGFGGGFLKDGVNAAEHFGRRPPGKGKQEDAAGIYAAGDQMGNAVGQGVGLAGASAGDDQ